ncbi:DNA/RNA polymerase, partial [Ramaria rubella]
MKVFIYNWELRSKNPVTIIAHGLTENNEYYRKVVDYFYPFCFTDPKNVKNMKVREMEYVTMRSSTNINSKATYSRVSFDDHLSMVKQCSNNGYMHDINITTMFLSEYKFPFTGWFETEQKLEPLPDVIPTFPKILSFDIECISSSGSGMPKPYKRGDRIEMISMVFGKYLDKSSRTNYLIYVGYKNEIVIDDCKCISCDTEQELLMNFGNIVSEEDPDIITGYNIFGFDFDYILKRCKLFLIPLPEISRSGETTSHPVAWSSSAYGENFYNRIEASGRIFIDMMIFFQRMNLGSYSLDFISRKFLGVGKKDISHENVWRDRSLIEEYARYCVNDSVLTIDLFNMFYMWTEVCEMSRAMMCSIEDIYTRGEQMKVLNQVVYSCISRGIVLKKIEQKEQWTNIKGALVMEPEIGLYRNCSVVDFQSMYPSIMILYNVCPSTFIGYKKFSTETVGILPYVAQQLISERKKVKEKIKDSDGMVRQILNSRQMSLKISANSLYGVLGFEKNQYLGHHGCSSSITGIGRQMLRSIAKYIVEECHHKVVYGDTDSCVIFFGENMSEEECKKTTNIICDRINNNLLTQPMTLNFEEFYDLMVFFTKKRYIMFKGDSIKYKGVAKVRSNYCNYVKKCYEDLIKAIGRIEDEEYLKNIVATSFVELLEGLVSIDDLVLTKSVKPLEQYKTQVSPQYIMARRLLHEGVDWQSRLEYIFVSNGGRLQGEKMYTPYEVERNNMKIDYLYYLDRQLIPALKDLLMVTKLDTFSSEIRKQLSDIYN